MISIDDHKLVLALIRKEGQRIIFNENSGQGSVGGPVFEGVGLRHLIDHGMLAHDPGVKLPKNLRRKFKAYRITPLGEREMKTLGNIKPEYPAESPKTPPPPPKLEVVEDSGLGVSKTPELEVTESSGGVSINEELEPEPKPIEGKTVVSEEQQPTALFIEKDTKLLATDTMARILAERYIEEGTEEGVTLVTTDPKTFLIMTQDVELVKSISNRGEDKEPKLGPKDAEEEGVLIVLTPLIEAAIVEPTDENLYRLADFYYKHLERYGEYKKVQSGEVSPDGSVLPWRKTISPPPPPPPPPIKIGGSAVPPPPPPPPPPVSER